MNKQVKKVLIVSSILFIVVSFIFLINNLQEEKEEDFGREPIPEEALIPLKQFMEEQKNESITPFNLENG